MSNTRYFLIRIEKIKFSFNLQKNDKQSVKNNRPVSFLPIFVLAKSSDVLLQYDVHIFPENNLTCENQSGVKTNDSFVDQLLSITHEIFSCFDDNYEIRGVFLDISKVSDEVRHEEIEMKELSLTAKVPFRLITIIYHIIFNVILRYSLMTRPCYLLLKYPKEQLIT